MSDTDPTPRGPQKAVQRRGNHIAVRTVLSCGCTVKARAVPWPLQRLGCTAGLVGHGYNLPWISYRLGEGPTIPNTPRPRPHELKKGRSQ
jgi:hypothetical protein